MKARGIEPILPGATRRRLQMCIECLEKCIPKAEECGVVMGSKYWAQPHARGQLRLVECRAVSWLAPHDTGNFMEDLTTNSADRSKTIYVQAKPTLAAANGTPWTSTTIASPKFCYAATPATSPSNSKAKKIRYCRPKKHHLSVKLLRSELSDV